MLTAKVFCIYLYLNRKGKHSGQVEANNIKKNKCTQKWRQANKLESLLTPVNLRTPLFNDSLRVINHWFSNLAIHWNHL
jgi:hypothetical protein